MMKKNKPIYEVTFYYIGGEIKPYMCAFEEDALKKFSLVRLMKMNSIESVNIKSAGKEVNIMLN